MRPCSNTEVLKEDQLETKKGCQTTLHVRNRESQRETTRLLQSDDRDPTQFGYV